MKIYKYTILCNNTKKIMYNTNIKPKLIDLQKYISIGNGISELKQVYTAYIYVRYDAKIRLYKYKHKI